MWRQARAHWLVWVSFFLFAISALVVHLVSINDGWNMNYRRLPRVGAVRGPTYQEALQEIQAVASLGWSPPAAGMEFAVVSSWATVAQVTSATAIFSKGIVYLLFATFLLPMWSLSFATEALGREREGQTLIWTLVRPISRPAIYLATYLAMLPWCLAFNLGGFYLLCRLGGEPGQTAFRLDWPAVLLGALAFAALFHLLGACLRRAGIVALLYAFFLETIAGNMPGLFKRLSISFYTRCIMFENGQPFGLGPDRPGLYQPVSGSTATFVLVSATVVFLVVGMVIFSRSEYLDVRS